MWSFSSYLLEINYFNKELIGSGLKIVEDCKIDGMEGIKDYSVRNYCMAKLILILLVLGDCSKLNLIKLYITKT
jgi:hypothetical protein